MRRMDTPTFRSVTIVVLGLASAMAGLYLLDAPLRRDVIAWFFLLPLGAILVSAAIWSLVSRFLDD